MGRRKIKSMLENSILWLWQCNYCKDITASYSHLTHDMNHCKCGKSAVDLEEYYARGMGDYDVISIKKYINGKWVKIND